MTGRKSPAALVKAPGFEFHQIIELYARPIKEYFIAGKETTMDHTATRTVVRRRPSGSPEGTPWTVVGDYDAPNHGAGPNARGMGLYATCHELPITQGYYAWKGECPGDWFHDHFCNDDTAYQLWHAYGNWSDEPACPRAGRVYRIFCRQMWASSPPPVPSPPWRLEAPPP